jgi:hypothetical protein
VYNIVVIIATGKMIKQDNLSYSLRQPIHRKVSRLYFKVKFIYSEKATKFYEIFTLLLTAVHTVKSKVKISQNFAAFSEYMNFTKGAL